MRGAEPKPGAKVASQLEADRSSHAMSKKCEWAAQSLRQRFSDRFNEIRQARNGRLLETRSTTWKLNRQNVNIRKAPSPSLICQSAASGKGETKELQCAGRLSFGLREPTIRFKCHLFSHLIR